MSEKPFNPEELPPASAEEPIVGEIPKVGKEPAMAAEVGEVLVSKSGTRRKVLGFMLDRSAPGGGFLEVETTKEGQTFKDKISFREVLEAKRRGAVTVEKPEESLEKTETISEKLEKDSDERTEEAAETKAESVSEKQDEEKAREIIEETARKEANLKPATPAEAEKTIPEFLKETPEEAPNPEDTEKKPRKPRAARPGSARTANPKTKSNKKAAGKEAEKEIDELPFAEAPKDILDNPELLKFLERYPDTKTSEAGELKDRLKVFEEAKLAEVRLAELYKNELEPALEVEISKEELSSVGDFLKAEAVENPERFRERIREIDRYVKQKKEVAELESEIKGLGGEENYDAAMEKMAEEQRAAEKYRGVVKWSTGWRGFLNPKNSELLGWAFRGNIPFLASKIKESADRSNLRKQMRSKSNWVANIFFTSAESKHYFQKYTEKIDKLAQDREFLGGYPSRKDYLESEFKKMRQDFFSKAEPARELLNIVRSEVTEQIGKLLRPSSISLDKLDEAQRRLEVLKTAQKTAGFEQLSNLPVEAFQQDIDSAISEVVVAEVNEKLQKFKIRNKPFSKLREQLNEYLDREVLGSKSKRETREFISNIITHEIHRLTNEKPKDYKSKLILLKVVLADINNT